MTMPRVLTIAGSDSSGGAGIQQDLKVFHALGVWGLTAVTSVTAQTPEHITARADVSPEVVAAQIAAATRDGIDAAKTGMLGTRAIVEAVAHELGELRPPLVVDPVLASSSGRPLLDDDGLNALRTELFPLADCVTPNAREAEALTGIGVDNLAGQRTAARHLLDLGVGSAIVTGGHVEGKDVIDVLAWPGGMVEIRGSRVAGGGAHGTGCTYSAAVVALLALGHGIEDAATRAQRMVEEGLRKREPGGLVV